jgi:vacuolar-type H+-ATPase subunit H
MSEVQDKSSSIKTNKPTKEEIIKAKAEAKEKARKAWEETLKIQKEKDQAWLDEKSKTMSDDEKDELFRQASKKCKDTTMKDGKIILVCPLPKKLEYCVNADSFTCANGKADTAQGCKLSSTVSEALKDDTTCIDGTFVSNAEGGSYLSPYVPWGPISGTSKRLIHPTLNYIERYFS